jgi:hypothetical protein
MTRSRRIKMLGASITATAAVGLVAGFSASPALASTQDHGGPAPSHQGHGSHAVIHFEGEAFNFEAAPEFKPLFVPGSPEVALSHGASFLKDGGFRLDGGSGTVSPDGHVTENLRGTVVYSDSEGSMSITIQATNFRLDTVTGPNEQSHLVADVTVSGSLMPHPVKVKGVDAIDLQDNKGSVSMRRHSIELRDVPGTLSTQASQVGGGILPPQQFLGDADFSVPAL